MSAVRPCPKCGAEVASDAAFCENCGAQVPDAGEDKVAAPPRRRGIRTVAVALGIALASAGAGFLGGYVAADDADRVSSLERSLDAARSAVQGANDELASAKSDNEQLGRENSDLQEQLDAERGLKGTGESSAAAGPPPDADLRMGQAGTVGALIIKPTSFDSTGSNGQATSYLLVMTVKNDGSEPVGPFCGGSEATVEDVQGRSFDGDGVIADNTPNCGDDLQPGLTADNFQVRFRLPVDAEPAIVRVSDEFDSGDEKTWAIGG